MRSSAPERGVHVDVVRAGDAEAALLDATSRGLQAAVKQLPAVWLYDARGSRLYEEITELPEYYLSRRESEILRARAATIAARTQARTLVELGAGSAKNTLYLLDALDGLGTLESFVPLDVSEQMLRASAEAIAERYRRITVHGLVGDFEDDLDRLPTEQRRLIAFLGSTIGNLSPMQRERFLGRAAGELGRDDALLIGFDLVKDAARLTAAYNDAAGATEAFVRNALDAVNTGLGAGFDQSRFAYEASWDGEHEWMDIGVRAQRTHTVAVPRLRLDVSFEAGEPLRVEISAKFRRERLEREFARAGLHLESWWTDAAGDFALALLCRDESQRSMR